MQIPKDEKDYLDLIQPFLVLQIFIPLGKNIHIEVGITDSQKTKRRLIFHSGAKEIVSNPLHARIPVTHFRKNQWINLSLDIFAFAHHCFKGVNIRSIDLLTVTASCKLRKIFTMKNPLYDDQEGDDPELQQLINDLMIEEQRENMPFEYVPKNLAFPQGFIHFNQLIFPQRLKYYQGSSNPDENFNNVNQLEQPNAKKEQKVQLAFGQRVKRTNIQQSSKKLKGESNNNNNAISNKKSNKSKDRQSVEPTQEDFYSPLTSEQNTKYNKNQNADFNDLSDDQIENNDTVETSRQKVSKADLKEETHILYLQNDSDEDDDDYQHQSKQRFVNKKQKQSNPWDNVGRQDHDVKVKRFKQITKDNTKVTPKRTLSKSNSKKNDQTSNNEGSPIVQRIEDNESKFYSPLSNMKNDVDNRLDSEMSEDLKIQQQVLKVNELSHLVNNIEFKYSKAVDYQKEQLYQKELISPEINKHRKTGQGFYRNKVNNNRVKLQQDDEDEEVKAMSKYNNFNLEQWETNQRDLEESENFIEEAFDLNHHNLINFDQQEPQKYASDIVKGRKSKEFNDNPMYIEFELNNDDQDLVQDNAKNEEVKASNVFNYPFGTENIDTNHSFQNLESSRKEERRPFSPPFKLPTNDHESLKPISDFQQKLDYLKVQRAEILRDSLDQSLPLMKSHQELPNDLPSKATVENEDGDLLEVIFDPVLKCYYDPKTNSYYEIKPQQ